MLKYFLISKRQVFPVWFHKKLETFAVEEHKRTEYVHTDDVTRFCLRYTYVRHVLQGPNQKRLLVSTAARRHTRVSRSREQIKRIKLHMILYSHNIEFCDVALVILLKNICSTFSVLQMVRTRTCYT